MMKLQFTTAFWSIGNGFDFIWCSSCFYHLFIGLFPVYSVEHSELPLGGELLHTDMFLFIVNTSLLTQLLCPFDGRASICWIALGQVHHLWSDLPAHHRIQTYREEAHACGRPYEHIKIWYYEHEYILLYLQLMCVVCCRCWCPWMFLSPWWTWHHPHQNSTLQTWLPAGRPSTAGRQWESFLCLENIKPRTVPCVTFFIYEG